MRTPRRRFLGALLAAPATLLAGAAFAARRPEVAILPLGAALPDRDVTAVRQALLAFYDVDLRLLDRAPLPKSAFYPPRRRYRAEKLLVTLERTLPEGGAFILGITSVDISTTKGEHPDWGILGLANLDGTACVASIHRCRRGARSARHATERFAKVAVHELGHALGLPHCAAGVACLMRDAGGTVVTIDEETDLCETCRGKLAHRGFVARRGRVPWGGE